MASRSQNFEGMLHRLAGERESRRTGGAASPRVAASVLSSATEWQARSIASEVGQTILEAYRELTGPDIRRIENVDADGASTIDFARLEKLIRKCSSKHAILRLRRQIALRHHPDVQTAQSGHEATATMARVNAMFDKAIREKFSATAR